MFFIGIFGIQQKQKEISTVRNIICPTCEGLGSYEVIKVYDYFHMFFLPVFKWNIRYYIRTSCCKKIMEVNLEVGERIEDGEIVEMKPEDVKELKRMTTSSICRNCGVTIDPHFTYCPYCGKHVR